ncbi:hypothetical protein LEP1GSC115_1058 [Leptospira interrogans serovar Australis str. 200703203]|uniref:Uncharacterized protein n=1 Tax=Leptospira interrogans serovar Australis str. 200703203 TaxID=1085541 RepID=N1UMH2_LEPIR|nr:hypothetical protein LEP1GSC115_1058 [Leptospira interrogans serovar Australis str. 200703203]
MIFKKPRQLTAGKEILRTESFTLIYLGAFHFHYSFILEEISITET